MLSRIKKDDLVFVLSGKDKGKEGRVLDIDTKNKTVLVKNISIVTRHVKAKKAGERGGILKEESYISLSRVMPVCSSCKKACRIQVKIKEDENKVRVCHRCKEEF